MKNNYFIERLIELSQEENIILHDNYKSYTAKTLFQESKKLANGLLAKGMKEGDIAIIATRPGAEFLKIVFATLMLRIKVAIIDPDMGHENYLAKVNQLNPQWAFMDYGLLLLQEHPILRYFYLKYKPETPYIPFTKKIKRIATGGWKPIIGKHSTLKKLHYRLQNGEQTIVQNEKDFEYIITYTSGSLSTPKGVVHSIDSISRSIKYIIKLLNDDKNKSIATHLPHFMLIGVFAGMKVHVWDENLNTTERFDFLNQNKISTLFAPPGELMDMISYCKNNNTYFPDTVKHILLGSAPTHIPFLKRLIDVVSEDTQITCMYGMTEHLVVATCDGREKVNYEVDGDLLGHIVEGIDIKINDSSEITLSSDHLFKRYLHLQKTDKYHKTGDLGYIDKNGLLILKGRKKNMIIRKNFNLYPSLYEPTIKQISGIEEAIYIGFYNEKIADEVVVLVIDSQDKIDEKMIFKKLRSGATKIDKEAIPDHIEFMRIPRKGRQLKVDFNLLRKTILAKYAK